MKMDKIDYNNFIKTLAKDDKLIRSEVTVFFD